MHRVFFVIVTELTLRSRSALIITLALLSIVASPALTAAAETPWSVSPLSASARQAMTGKSWKPGCPAPLADLRAIDVLYVGFDGMQHNGTIVVHKRFTSDVVAIFQELYKARFPIHKVAPWEQYGSNVYAQRDITVGFYCEKADDDPSEWTSHAFGMAIDINPFENPFLNEHGQWWPAAAAANGPREAGRGKITWDSPALLIFARHGWSWGGFFHGEKDYMHFTKVAVGGSHDLLARPYVVNQLQYLPDAGRDASRPGQ